MMNIYIEPKKHYYKRSRIGIIQAIALFGLLVLMGILAHHRFTEDGFTYHVFTLSFVLCLMILMYILITPHLLLKTRFVIKSESFRPPEIPLFQFIPKNIHYSQIKNYKMLIDKHSGDSEYIVLNPEQKDEIIISSKQVNKEGIEALRTKLKELEVHEEIVKSKK